MLPNGTPHTHLIGSKTQAQTQPILQSIVLQIQQYHRATTAVFRQGGQEQIYQQSNIVKSTK